jgi:hypothetical protein
MAKPDKMTADEAAYLTAWVLIHGTEPIFATVDPIKKAAFGIESFEHYTVSRNWVHSSLSHMRDRGYLARTSKAQHGVTDKAIQELSTYGYIVDNNKGE